MNNLVRPLPSGQNKAGLLEKIRHYHWNTSCIANKKVNIGRQASCISEYKSYKTNEQVALLRNEWIENKMKGYISPPFPTRSHYPKCFVVTIS